MNPPAEKPARALVDPQLALRSAGLEAGGRGLETQASAAAGGLWGAAQPLCLAALTLRLQGPWLAVVSTEAEAFGLALDLEQFGVAAVTLPSRGETGARAGRDVDSDALRERLLAAQRLAGGPPAGPPGAR